jgi:hypothetical protein
MKVQQIAELMDQICELAQKDKDVNALICEGYPFEGSLDEISCDVIVWRDTMKDAAIGNERTWLWKWTEGGYNTCRAKTREEALAKAKEKGKPNEVFKGLTVDEKTLHVATDKEVAETDKRFAGMFD